ncbi:putative RNA polymerase II transcription factor SIII, subunit A [Septoria linicola]|nr:putative RNA polymerase II transcription factor SIII, subunit A [Septoria linicola]
MPVSSLLAMAIRCAHRNIESIDNLSDMPFEMARPIMKKITNPHQLRELEINSPHLAEYTGEFWQAFIRRDLPNLPDKDMLYPKNPASWHKIYRKLMRSEKAREAEQEEQLRLTLLGNKVKKEEKKAMFVDRILHHAREEPTVFVDGQRKKGGWSAGPPTLNRAKNGTDALAAIRNKSAQNSRQLAMGRPFQSNVHGVNSTRGAQQIRQAPESMLREANQRGRMEIAPRDLLPHQRDMLQEQRRANATIKVHAPGRIRTAKFAAQHQKQNEDAVRQTREVNEARLRALTQSANAAASAKKSKAKFDFAPAPETGSPEPKHSTPIQPSTPAASPPAQAATPPKQASPPPVIIKKRPAPGGSIFMKPTKKARH